jgi:hypothetical protein
VYLIGLCICSATLVIRALVFGVFAYPRSYFDSSPSLTLLSVVTSYWLDGPGIEFRWEARFSAPVQTGLGHTQPPIQWVPGLFPGVKLSGAWL